MFLTILFILYYLQKMFKYNANKDLDWGKIVNELDCVTFPYILQQNPIFENLIKNIEKLVSKKCQIIPAHIFVDKISKILLNEMFKYWTEMEGPNLKAMSIIDDGIRYLITYYEGIPAEVDYQAYLFNLSSNNKKILYKIIDKNIIQKRCIIPSYPL